MPLNPPDIKELKAIIDWVTLTHDVRELSLKYGEVELFISRNENSSEPPVKLREPASVATAPGAAATAAAGTAPVAQPPAGSVVPEPTAAVASAQADAAPSATASALSPTIPAREASTANQEVVTAPMVGIFYAAPKPGAPAFVEVGTKVQPGTVLCIVEVMKLMNNIESTVTGTVAQILVANNEAVAYGQPIMVIERDV